MSDEAKKENRRRYMLVLIPSLAFGGGSAYIGSTLKDVTKAIEAAGETTKQISAVLSQPKKPLAFSCASTFEVKPVPVKR